MRKTVDWRCVVAHARQVRPELDHLREGGSEQESGLVLGLLNVVADYRETADEAAA